MKSLSPRILATAIFLSVVAAVFYFYPKTNTTEVPSFLNQSFSDYDGRSVSLSIYSDQPMVINTWASWCPFCTEEMPDFAKLQEEYAGRVTVVAINRAETKDQAKRYTDQLGVTGKMVLLLDPTDSFYNSIGGISMPETIFVKDGKIYEQKRVILTLQEMRDRVEEILN